MKYIILLSICLAGILSGAQTNDEDYSLTEYYYPLRVQVRDTIGIEVAYIDFNNGHTIIRGNLEVGLKKLSEIIQGTFQEATAANAIRMQLNATGTVKSRVLLTQAIKTYDSIRAVYGK